MSAPETPTPSPTDPSKGASQRRPLGRWFISRNPWVVPAITRVHRWLYQKLGGRLVAAAGRTKILLLTTIGRRSGEPRVTPLLYVEDGADFVVVASNGGQERVPAWWLNLQARPEATIAVKGLEPQRVRARAAEGDEHDRLWARWREIDRDLDAWSARRSTPATVVVLDVLGPAGG